MSSQASTTQTDKKHVAVSGGKKRMAKTTAVDVTLTAQEASYGFVTVTAAAKTVTLPAATAKLNGADVVVAPVGAFNTDVNIAGAAAFGNGGATKDLATVVQGTAGHFICDGTYWYVVSAPTLA